MSGRSAPLTAGVALVEEDPQRCYLLFAGSHQVPRGGLGDLVGTFTSETTARQAFRRYRLDHTSGRSWAQLAVVDAHDGIRPLCWFGIGAPPFRKPVTVGRPENRMHHQTEGGVMQVATRESRSPAGPKIEPTARPRRMKKIASALIGILAVGMATVGVISHNEPSQPAQPRPAPVDASRTANRPVPPPVDTAPVLDGVGSVDG